MAVLSKAGYIKVTLISPARGEYQTYDGNMGTIGGEVTYDGSIPYRAPVVLLRKHGAVVAITHTDDLGAFTFGPIEKRDDYEVVVMGNGDWRSKVVGPLRWV